MKSSNHEKIVNKNTQDIFLRNAILSLLNLMNREIIIDMIREGKVEKYDIPFFYNQGGNQGFMQDFFIDLQMIVNILNLQKEIMILFPEEL